MARVVMIRHEDDPLDDRITTWFRARGIEPEVVRPYLGEEIGLHHDVIASAVYGGPFNVFEEDRHPFLHHENAWIEGCLARDIPILGICQGAQSMARVLGAEAGPLDPEVHEFGYYPIQPTAAGADLIPDGLMVAQAHFHGFDVPSGAELLARSDLFPHQAMRVAPTAYAFQFHAEQTPAGFARWQARSWAAYGKPGAQTREEQDRLMTVHDGAMGDWFEGFLDQLYGPVLAEQVAAE